MKRAKESRTTMWRKKMRRKEARRDCCVHHQEAAMVQVSGNRNSACSPQLIPLVQFQNEVISNEDCAELSHISQTSSRPEATVQSNERGCRKTECKSATHAGSLGCGSGGPDDPGDEPEDFDAGPDDSDVEAEDSAGPDSEIEAEDSDGVRNDSEDSEVEEDHDDQPGDSHGGSEDSYCEAEDSHGRPGNSVAGARDLDDKREESHAGPEECEVGAEDHEDKPGDSNAGSEDSELRTEDSDSELEVSELEAEDCYSEAEDCQGGAEDHEDEPGDSHAGSEDSEFRAEDSDSEAEDSELQAEDSYSGPEDSQGGAEDSDVGQEDSEIDLEDPNGEVVDFDVVREDLCDEAQSPEREPEDLQDVREIADGYQENHDEQENREDQEIQEAQENPEDQENEVQENPEDQENNEVQENFEDRQENIEDEQENPDDDPDDPPPDDGSGDDGATSSDDESNLTFRHLDLNTVLQSRNVCTLRESLALLLAISVRNDLPYIAVIHTMKALNAIHGRKYFPEDKKQLWHLLGRNEVGITKHVYCQNCLLGHGRFHNLDENIVCPCGSIIRKRTAKVFITLNLRKQFAELLGRERIREVIINRENRQLRVGDSMEDILDGSEYKALCEGNNVLASVHNYSYTFNLDGFRLTKSSNAEAWPIYVKWNELPWKSRQKHMMLAGVWIDTKKPHMNVFLENFVEQANSLSNRGVRWQTAAGNEMISKFVPTCCVVDAQARCALLNMQSPSGYYGCPMCDHAGLYVGGAVHFPYLPPVRMPERRTDAEIKRCMAEAAGNGDGHLLGFKGPSQLMLMEYLNLGKGVVTDDIHPFSGVIEHHMSILTTRTRENIPPYYIGGAHQLAVIDGRLLSIRTPTKISRKPRPFSTRRRWKSSEWRNFLLYYSVPCLEGILPRRYLRHLELYAQAIFLLSGGHVSQEDCNTAERLLTEYVTLFERFFGRENMRYNVHILIHVADCVREWGPTYGHSTSFFETWNGALGSTVTSPKASADQIVLRFLIKRFLDNVEDDNDISERIKTQVNDILYSPRAREHVTVGNVLFLGKCTRRHPDAAEAEALRQENVFHNELLVYRRAEVDGVEYRSSDYLYAGEETKSDNSKVFTWNDEFAEIACIAVVGEGEERRGFLFLNILNINAFRNRYISKVSDEPQGRVLMVATFEDIKSPAIKCETPNGVYIFPMANTREQD